MNGSAIRRPGYDLSIEVTESLTLHFPELDDQELAGLDQAATAVVRFRPGRRVSFGQLAADLREKRGQAVYVYPRKRGQRWVELVEARRVASLAQDLEDLLQDCRLRRAVKATG